MYLFAHAAVPSSIYSFIPLFVCSCIPSVVYAFAHLSVYSVIHLFIHAFAPSFIRSIRPSVVVHSFNQSFVHVFRPSFIPSFMYSFFQPPRGRPPIPILIVLRYPSARAISTPSISVAQLCIVLSKGQTTLRSHPAAAFNTSKPVGT